MHCLTCLGISRHISRKLIPCFWIREWENITYKKHLWVRKKEEGFNEGVLAHLTKSRNPEIDSTDGVGDMHTWLLRSASPIFHKTKSHHNLSQTPFIPSAKHQIIIYINNPWKTWLKMSCILSNSPQQIALMQRRPLWFTSPLTKDKHEQNTKVSFKSLYSDFLTNCTVGILFLQFFAWCPLWKTKWKIHFPVPIYQKTEAFTEMYLKIPWKLKGYRNCLFLRRYKIKCQRWNLHSTSPNKPLSIVMFSPTFGLQLFLSDTLDAALCNIFFRFHSAFFTLLFWQWSVN